METLYTEWVLEGPEAFAKGMVLGIAASRGKAEKVFFCGDGGLPAEPLLERVLEWVKVRKDRLHCLVDRELDPVLEGILGAAGKPYGLMICGKKAVRFAALPFTYETFSPPHAEALEKLFAALPGSLRLERYEIKKTLEPGARGAELYAPCHEFAVRASGRIEGPVDELLLFRGRMAENELIESKTIELGYG